jgi:hypothetical protein
MAHVTATAPGTSASWSCSGLRQGLAYMYQLTSQTLRTLSPSLHVWQMVKALSSARTTCDAACVDVARERGSEVVHHGLRTGRGVLTRLRSHACSIESICAGQVTEGWIWS